MRVLLLMLVWAAVATAKPSLYHGYVPSTYSAYYPYSLSSQYHAQDELGQYSYGYSGDTSAKHETKTLDGITRGGYSYVDANGIVQTVSYVSDPVNGFRVAATNLPRDPAPVVAAPAVVASPLPVTETPEVARAKAEHLAAVQKAADAAAAAPDDAPAVAPLAPVVATTYHHAAPLSGISYAYGTGYPFAIGAYSHIPAATSYSALTPLSSQYHAQDELGQYSYGYSGGPSAKHEAKTLDGVTRGSYSYVDANGIVQTVSYVSDPVNGFRVAATNLPRDPAPVVAAPAVVASPLPVTETPEVARAKAEHLAAVQKAADAAAAAPDDAPAVAPLAPVVATTYHHAAPLSGISYAYGTGYPFAIGAYSYIPAATSYSALTPLSSQYHAQDELGQYSYGYSGGPSAKHEAKTLDGVTRGSYSYVDANGIVQTVSYLADDVYGFRVVATNLPVSPASH